MKSVGLKKSTQRAQRKDAENAGNHARPCIFFFFFALCVDFFWLAPPGGTSCPATFMLPSFAVLL
jgi:hypothetical protein